MKQALSIFFFGFSVALTARPAWAGEAETAAVARAVAAKELAMDMPSEARWRETYTRFIEADQLRHATELQYELGYAAAQLGWTDIAANHYADALELGLSEPARTKAHDFIAQHEPTLGRIQLQGKASSQVWVGNNWHTSLPLERALFVIPGIVMVRVEDPDNHAVEIRKLEVKPGEAIGVSFPAADPQPPPPTQPVPAPPLTSNLTLSAPLAPTAPQALDTKATNVSSWLLGAGLGTLLASGGVLAVSLVKLKGKRDDLREVCEVPLSSSGNGCKNSTLGHYDDARALSRDIAHWRTAETLSLVGLGLGVASTTIGLFLPQPTARRSSWRFEAEINKSGMWLNAAQRF